MISKSIQPLMVLLLAMGTIASCTYDYSLATETVCDDGQDNDGDGLADCDDSDCDGTTTCVEPGNCDDGIDNDGDGLVDCNDSDCDGTTTCVELGNCNDGIDNDDDDLIDCLDDDCASDPVCLREELCDDGIDNDEDGNIDCDDDDCESTLPCQGAACNENGTCEGYEDCLWCPDCCPVCDPYEGTNYDYIIYEMVTPTTAASDYEIGVDLDGDGIVDSNLGRLIGMFPEKTGEDLNADLANDIQHGEYILLMRMVISAWPDDDQILVQTLKGLTDATMDATEDNLTGAGNALIDPIVDRGLHLCGALTDGAISAGPGTLDFPLSLMKGSVVYITLQGARVEAVGPVNPNGFQDLMVGGGIDRNTVNNQILPYMTLYMNEKIITDPGSGWVALMLSTIDGACDNTLEGCESVTAGSGECTIWDNDPTNPPITPTELRCYPVFHDAIKPDIDLDNDGEADVLALGYKLSGMPITITN